MVRFLFWTLTLSPLFLILSCSTSSKNDLRTDTAAQVWLQTYAKALAMKDTDPAKACSYFSQLAAEGKFLLKDLSLLRARMLCEDVSALPAVDEKLGQTFPHLQSLNTERILIEANRAKNSIELAKAYRAKAMASDRSREKLKLLQAGLEVLNQDTGVKDEALATDLQNRIYQVAPRLRPTPAAENFYKVGADFIYNREFQKGRSFLEKIFTDKSFDFEDQIQARKLFRNSFKTEQNRTQFLVEAEKFTLWIEHQKKIDWKLLHESYLTWARGAWTLGQVAEAQQVLTKAEKKLKRHWHLDEIEFVRGRMSEEIGHWQEALAHYEKALQDTRNERGGLHERLLFSQAWMLRKMSKFADAATVLENLRNQTQDPFDQNKFSFWLARTYQQAGQPEKFKTELDRLKVEDSLGFYGLLAYRDLGEEMPPLPMSKMNNLDWNALDADSRKWISALLAVKETEVLEKYLQQRTSQLKLAGSTSDKAYSETWLTYLKAYAAAGLYLPLFAQIGSLEANLKMDLLKENPELLFPRKYLEFIDPAADKFKVRPELILAIIRQESAFNPYARSPADAFGLMQLLPSAGKDQFGLTGITLNHHEDLYDPAINVPIGAALLSQLQRKYRNQFILTAAAYNASEKAIEGWIRTRLKEDPLEFIEDIPYDETRAYVKLVIRNFTFYSRLKDPSKKLAFPSWCLEDLQSFKEIPK